MDAEIQFFMTQKDHAEFLEYADTVVLDIIQHENDYHLMVGDCGLHLVPSEQEGEIMYAGRLEIRLGQTDIPYQDLERAKSAFRKLRNWIKKHYWSRLAYLNKNKKNKLTPSRVHWLGPDAKRWKESDPDKHVLKLSKTSWMQFEIGF